MERTEEFVFGDMNIYSKIDSDRFGIKVGKVPEDFFQENGVEYFIDNGFELIITRIDITNLELINSLELSGFVLGDTQTVFQQPLNKEKLNNFEVRNKDYVYRGYHPTDLDTLMEITETSFDGYYGHYFNDKRLNQKDCLDAYVDWVHNSCVDEKLTDAIIVAEKNGEIGGYISVKIYYCDGKKYGDGVLGAVSPNHRGLGLFSDIGLKVLKWCAENDCEWVENNVVINNYPVVRTYIGLGYKPYKAMVTLHGWVDEIKKRIICQKNQ